MGMFDNIRCEVPLPDGIEAGELQTKDFDCEMVTHVISKDGRLMLYCGHYESVPLLERPHWKAEWGDSEEALKEHSIDALCGSIRRVPKYEDANYHGVVNFYWSFGDKWREFNAKFTDGQLVKIEVVTEHAHPTRGE